MLQIRFQKYQLIGFYRKSSSKVHKNVDCEIIRWNRSGKRLPAVLEDEKKLSMLWELYRVIFVDSILQSQEGILYYKLLHREWNKIINSETLRKK